MDEPKFRVDILYGTVEIVATQRWEGNTLILGGYSIHRDLHGREVSRTADTENVRCTDPTERARKWWEFWRA